VEFSSGFFGGLLTGSGSWKIKLSETELFYYKDGKIFLRVLYVDIIDIKHSKGVVWADVFVKCQDNSFKLDGIENSDGKKLFDFILAKVTNALFNLVEPHQRRIQQILSSLDTLFCIDKYLSHYDILEFIKQQASDVDKRPSSSSSQYHTRRRQ
jgi:hypothetical protein